MPDLVWPILVQRAIKESAAAGDNTATAIPGAARSDAAALLGLSKKLMLGDSSEVSVGNSLFGAIAQLLAGQASLRHAFVRGANSDVYDGSWCPSFSMHDISA
jgi:hypothetical protein